MRAELPGTSKRRTGAVALVVLACLVLIVLLSGILLKVAVAQRERVRISTPRSFSCRSQARSSGEAFIVRGNTRPLEPTKVDCPSPSAQATSSAGDSASSHGSTAVRPAP